MKSLVIALLMVSNIYQTTGIVTEIDKVNDVVTVTNFEGEQFQFEEVEDWLIGDIAQMVMYDNGTEEVEDDEIIDVRYIGYDVELWELDNMWNIEN